ncbi:hypothetical protein [Flavobacterium sp.]|uniref:hypothetical protein n=1 Tax=Flavobacterium sp. TaxID=239 RepID=UPI0026311046|nr:hypothetical protein [Flavobacterium sp.]MDG2432081.1 hypothetical protein [Flavobacterium sp.]
MTKRKEGQNEEDDKLMGLTSENGRTNEKEIINLNQKFIHLFCLAEDRSISAN